MENILAAHWLAQPKRCLRLEGAARCAPLARSQAWRARVASLSLRARRKHASERASEQTSACALHAAGPRLHVRLRQPLVGAAVM